MPACADIASISLDVWTVSEESDGERLAVSSDLCTSALILSDISPPPICRFLKVSLIQCAIQFHSYIEQLILVANCV